MSKKVIIVESPAKAKTIEGYFKGDVTVLSSVGHIRDLAIAGKDGLGVDVENEFEPTYRVIKGKQKVINELVKKSKGAEILLATDPDREGEAIAWHLAEVLEMDLNEKNRIVFREITKTAIHEAINKPRLVDINLVHSQETRRILDRIIGFKLSKLLQTKIKAKSAGRVQSVALKLITDLEKIIQAFVPEEYYLISAFFDEIKADYILKKDQMVKREEADKIVETSTNPFKVQTVTVKTSTRFPRAPYITSTFQQDAINTLYMTSSRAMMVAQKLYEGIEINGELVGLITYMRTDSDRLSNEFVFSAKRYIDNNFGKEYHGSYKTSKKEASQDAHEAIRPSDINLTPESIESFLTKDEFRVYKKIYDRALSSLMAPAKFIQTDIVLNSNDNLYKMDGSVLEFDGFYKQTQDSPKDKVLPDLKEGDVINADTVEALQKETTPPARFSEATLIKELESLGIGRPSTYSSVMNTLKARAYVKVEKRRFVPTDQGILTATELGKFFKNIMDVQYTSKMELELDEIAEGKFEGVRLLREFYDDFIPQLEIAQKDMETVKAKVSDKICPLCGSPLLIRRSVYGEFLGCSNFPKCKHIESIEE